MDGTQSHFRAKPNIHCYDQGIPIVTLYSYLSLRQSRLAQFYQALLLVNPTEVEIFYQHLCRKALVLANPTGSRNILTKKL